MHNIRILFSVGLLLGHLFFTALSAAASLPVTLKSSFGGCPYICTLYSVEPYVGGHNVTFSDVVPVYSAALASALIGRKNHMGKWNVLFKYMPVDDYVGYDSKKAIFFVRKYYDRVGVSLAVAEKYADKEECRVELKSLGGEKIVDHRIYRVDDVSTPALFYDDGSGAIHHRANLFDMLDQTIDGYILSHGIAQLITKNNAEGKKIEQLEISIFCTIEMKLPDDEIYRIAGFLQYTFDAEKKYCYHRAFKPITPSHMVYLSNNPMSSYVLKCATRELIADAAGCKETQNAKMFARYLERCGDVDAIATALKRALH